MKNYNSSKNQEIKRKFVERDVMACVSGMVEYIINKGFEDREAPFSLDDAENYYTTKCPECGDTGSMEETENENGETIYKCTYCNHKQEEEFDTEPQEVYEWWIVTNWLGEKLKKHNRVIINDGFNTIWGRTTTGQAILLDGVISEICSELEILEGQKNEWNV